MSAVTHRLYHRLQLAAHRLRKQADRAVGDAVGLSTAQVSVLSVLAGGEPQTQRAVARELGLNESALTPMVGRLLARGLISRARDPSDVRAWRLALTEQGKETLARTKAPFATVNEVLDKTLDEDEIKALVGYLNRLIDALE